MQLGRYQISSVLGRGAMGVVYLAQDPLLGRAVAVKTIRLEEYLDPAEREMLRQRLFREARSAGSLSHPNIVTVHDVAEEGELAYVVMEYVKGLALSRILSAPEAPDRGMVVSVLRQIASALDYAHENRVYHRDIKPSNIILHESGTAKVTDFGIAKIATTQQMTASGVSMGTPNYMSPEQIASGPVDGRSDQYSLAVMAFELVAGDLPFRAENLAQLTYQVFHGEPQKARALNPSLSPGVEVVLLRGLRKNPAERYGTCREFVSVLEAALNTSPGWRTVARRPRGEPATPAPVATPAATPARTDSVWTNAPAEAVTLPPPPQGAGSETSRSWPRRSVWLLAPLVVVGGLLISYRVVIQREERAPPAVEVARPPARVAPAVAEPAAPPVTPPKSPSPPAESARPAVAPPVTPPKKSPPQPETRAVPPAPPPAAGKRTEPAARPPFPSSVLLPRSQPARPAAVEAPAPELPVQQAPPAPAPVTPPVTVPQPPPPERPSSGEVVWTGELDSDGVLTIHGARGLLRGDPSGALSGPLPGLPVEIIEVSPAAVRIQTPPRSDSKWVVVVLVNQGPRVTQILIRWRLTVP